MLAALLEPAFYRDAPSEDGISARLAAQFAEARSYEDELDRARIFGQEQKFLISVRLLTGALSPQEAGRAFALLAEVVIAGLLERVEVEFAKTHGRFPAARRRSPPWENSAGAK